MSAQRHHSSLFFAALLAVWLLIAQAAAQLELHFIDVGQGDAVMIRTPSGQVVLYDAGTPATLVRDYLLREGVRSIDLMVASHAHADHIGGLAAVVEALPVRFFMDNGIPATTQTYERLLRALLQREVPLLEAGERTITLGEVRLYFLPMPGQAGWGQNDNSIGVVVEYGDFRATLLGDSEPRQQGWWLQHAAGLLSDVKVHKASHHGSRNGDTDAMMRRLRPELVVIGVGEGNRYAHPHPEGLARYAAVGAVVLRSDRQGTVVVRAEADGTFEVRFAGPAPEPPGATPSTAVAPPPSASGCIDINRASADELTGIVHIGPARARELIGLRPLNSVEDLARINGIGAQRLRDIVAEGLACVATP